MNKISLREFSALPPARQHAYVSNQCTYLTCRHEGEAVRVYLYEAGGYFIEVWYDQLELNILRMHPFSDSRLLEAYAERVDIRAILS